MDNDTGGGIRHVLANADKLRWRCRLGEASRRKETKEKQAKQHVGKSTPSMGDLPSWILVKFFKILNLFGKMSVA